MKLSHRRGVRRIALMPAAILMAASLVLAGCGGPAGPSHNANQHGGQGSQDAVDAALKAGGTITYWTWGPSAQKQVEAFQTQYPNVKVNLVNAGTGNDEYTKLQNVIKSGSGAPDVAAIEYFALPQFAIPGDLVDLTQYGFDAFKSDFTPSTWAAVHSGGGLYGLPQDSGPMAMFYNKKLFDKHGIAVPKTWDEYVADAKKLHQEDPTKYIAVDSGDPVFAMGMIWQAGGRPFAVDGKNISINLQDAGTMKWTGVWNQLVQNGLVANIPGWSDAWFKAISSGTIATVPAGAWMAGVLEGLKGGKGEWRVAPLPTYDGQPVTAEHGGSSQAILKQSKNPALAAAFVRWLKSPAGVKLLLDAGAFPSTVADLRSPTFLNQAPTNFGGQKINQVLTEAAGTVPNGWQFLPYQTYANSIFGDTVGKSYQTKSDLNTGLKAWQKALVDYGNKQGFNIKD
jgi:multiple sugar transport system substrate-binding protein